jgi:hypothetical protein
VLAPVAHLAALPARLKALLEDGRVWKAGCGVTGDAAKVLADLKVRVAPLFDVSLVAPRLAPLKRAVQVFGGGGYVSDNVAERFYRDVRLFRLYEGTSQIHLLNIAKRTLALAEQDR